MENKINSVIGASGIHHIALHASDFEKSYDFYTRVLGFKEFRRWKKDGEITIALLDTGNGQYIELFSHGKERSFEDTQSGMYVHLALQVEDSVKAFERAVSCGAKSKMAPKIMELPSEPPVPVVISFVYGPDGEEIEFFQCR